MEVLSESDIISALEPLKEWTYDGKKLHAKFSFSDFRSAFSFITYVALIAERLNHHPELFNSYSKVELWLTTHDIGGVSQLDIKFAQETSKFI